MKRQEFIAGGAAMAWSLGASAQHRAKIPQIGYLSVNPSNYQSPRVFAQGLRDLGYVEGRNVVLEIRDAEGKFERLPARAAELVARKVDVIVAPGPPHALAAKQASRTIAINFAGVADPVADGLVTSLAQPNGKVTGLSALAPELVGKRLELPMEVVAGIGRVAILWQPGAFGDTTEKDLPKETEVVARALGIRLQFAEARGPADFARAFSEMVSACVDALTRMWGCMCFFERRGLVELGAKNRLPAVYPLREHIDAGGLFAFGPNRADSIGYAATDVDKILKGAKRADLPVEQPTKFALAISRKTAKALGITIPPSLLSRANEVLE